MKNLPLIFILGLLFIFPVFTSCGKSVESTSNINSKFSLNSNNTIVATDARWPPFESINEITGQIEGLDIDIFNAISLKQNFQVDYKNITWDALLAGISQGIYDVAISSITITEDIKKSMLFSDPYLAAGQIIVVRNNETAISSADSLQGVVGIQQDSLSEDEIKNIHVDLIVFYKDVDQAMQDLINGKVDAIICDYPLALAYTSRYSDKLKTVGSTFTDEAYVIAVSKDKTELLNKINSGLKTLKDDGSLDQIIRKWLN